jgi:hypothetical protein
VIDVGGGGVIDGADAMLKRDGRQGSKGGKRKGTWKQAVLYEQT